MLHGRVCEGTSSAMSDAGGAIPADAMTQIETAKLFGLNPEARLTLARSTTTLARGQTGLSPWN